MTSIHPASQTRETKYGAMKNALVAPSYPWTIKMRKEFKIRSGPATTLRYPNQRGKTPHITTVNPKMSKWTPVKTEVGKKGRDKKMDEETKKIKH